MNDRRCAAAGSVRRTDVTNDRRPPLPQAETRRDDADDDVSPAEFVIEPGPDGKPTLGLREGEYEQRYTLGDAYSCSLFIALCRREGLSPYRRPRQRDVNVCLRTTLTMHEKVWARFVALSAKLDGQLVDLTLKFVRDEVQR